MSTLTGPYTATWKIITGSAAVGSSSTWAVIGMPRFAPLQYEQASMVITLSGTLRRARKR